MGDYNPRQITQMRWKDAKALEHFKFISGEFGFGSEVLEQASKQKPWSKIVDILKDDNAHRSVLISDITNTEFYFGTQDNNFLNLQNLYDKYGVTVDIQYDRSTDKLTITRIEKTFLTDADAPKMYRHNLKISHKRTGYDDSQHDIFLTYYSSNNLVADTPEKLKTLTKAINGTNLRSPVYSITNTGSSDYDKISLYYIGAVYNGSAWNLMNSNGTSSGIAINSVTDTVEEA